MSSTPSEKTEVELLYQGPAEEVSSGEDPPMSEWSSLEIGLELENKEKFLSAEGLYAPGSGEMCTKYIAQSDSEVLRHVYYNYPAVTDPGIRAALLSGQVPTIYSDDGTDLYKSLCREMNTCPVSLFYSKLLSSDINLSYYGVSPRAIRPMAMALQYNKSVKSFDLTDNFLDDDACYHLGQMLYMNVTLEILNLTGCRIGYSGLLRLGDTLHLNKTLSTLNLARNHLGEQGGVLYAKLIANGVAIKRLSLRKNGLAFQAALALADVFLYKDTITHLDLSMNELYHVPSVVKLLDALSESAILEDLNLSYTGLEGERVAGALNNLLNVPTLSTLNLSNNKLKGEALEAFLPGLTKAKKLNTLDLSSNPLSPEDALMVLNMMLKPRVKIQDLLMENVWVSKEFPLLLARVKNMKSRKNFTIEYAGILGNWSIQGDDPRALILKRADYLGNVSKKRKVDVPLFFLALFKENPKPMSVTDLMDRAKFESVPIDDELMKELASVFPGPKSAKAKFINMEALCDYVHRLWPDRKLPPTPPPEPEPEPIIETKKSKKGKRK